MNKFYLLIFSCLFSLQANAWNSLGHRLVAQIAYDQMCPEAIRIAKVYNHALDKVYRPQSLVNSAAWLDSLHSPDELWLKPKHYIDLPFSFDGTRLRPQQKDNAVNAVEEAKAVLFSDADDFSKGFNLRILMHVVADLHQPLHASSQFSAAYPYGDKGGNLVKLKANPIAANLHSYWDKGGGFLKPRKISNRQLQRMAWTLEQEWPCDLQKMNKNPMIWAEESHQLAINKAYLLKAGERPSEEYQHMAKELTQKQLALAGCRLAAILNDLTRSSKRHF